MSADHWYVTRALIAGLPETRIQPIVRPYVAVAQALFGANPFERRQRAANATAGSHRRSAPEKGCCRRTDAVMRDGDELADAM